MTVERRFVFTGVCRPTNVRSPILLARSLPASSDTSPVTTVRRRKSSAMSPAASATSASSASSARSAARSDQPRRDHGWPASTSARLRVARLMALCAVFALGAIVLSTRFADAGSGNPATTGASSGPVSAPSVVIVQPGETLWSVARALQPSGDVRPLVARLTRAHGGSGVRAGDRLSIPSDVAEPSSPTP